MTISHHLKFIFIHAQRTGGSTVINLLKKQLRAKVEIISQHGNARSSEKYLLDDYKDYYTFGFARNPWDRILSWYLLINKHNLKSIDAERLNFEKFVELDLSSTKGDPDFHYNQLDYFSNDKNELLTNKIYLFQNFESEVKAMFQDLGLPLIDPPKMNASREVNYRDYYTLKSRELIGRKCKKDIDYFGFEF